VNERFADGAVRRAVLLRPGDDPAIEPGQLMVRVLLPAPDDRGDYGQALAAWQDAHRDGMGRLRRELSLRLPAARRLEFTFDDTDPATPRILRPFPVSAAVHIAVPFARSVNPVTGTNWQGTGVVPDVAVPQAQAYDTAYAMALRHVLATDDLRPPIAAEAREALAARPG
jgi:hypothetical protein